jgi:hypothetical protein
MGESHHPASHVADGSVVGEADVNSFRLGMKRATGIVSRWILANA